jgi:hypothetical protein
MPNNSGAIKFEFLVKPPGSYIHTHKIVFYLRNDGSKDRPMTLMINFSSSVLAASRKEHHHPQSHLEGA